MLYVCGVRTASLKVRSHLVPSMWKVMQLGKTNQKFHLSIFFAEFSVAQLLCSLGLHYA